MNAVDQRLMDNPHQGINAHHIRSGWLIHKKRTVRLRQKMAVKWGFRGCNPVPTPIP
jgi:hypothetical protein